MSLEIFWVDSQLEFKERISRKIGMRIILTWIKWAGYYILLVTCMDQKNNKIIKK
jgi:hypothetical protein